MSTPMDMDPGVACALSPLVRRVVAPNPGLMTGPGTNTYLVGIDEVAVIDPGPDDASHVDAVVGAAVRERIRWIVLTHTHPDHWPAAVAIARRTGAAILGFAPVPKIDGDVPIGRAVADGDRIEGTEFGLQAIHTPGHAPNHLCLYLEEERALFSGDHVLSGTTTVVNPRRGGDMVAYLASLDRLRSLRRVACIFPGHGDVLTDARAVLDEYVAHRAEREQQILDALIAEPARIREIVERVYEAEIPEGLVPVAECQVHAHLLKLRDEGRVRGRSVRSVWRAA